MVNSYNGTVMARPGTEPNISSLTASLSPLQPLQQAVEASQHGGPGRGRGGPPPLHHQERGTGRDSSHRGWGCCQRQQRSHHGHLDHRREGGSKEGGSKARGREEGGEEGRC